MNLSRCFFALFLAFSSVAPSYAETPSHPYGIPPELDKAIDKGLNLLYDLRFEEALEIFNSQLDKADEHPTVHYGIVAAHWWYLSVFVLETDPEESKPFFEAVEKCIAVCKKKISEDNDPYGEAHLTLGGVYGLVGRWDATNRNWMKAYFGGKKAYKFLVKALAINPNLSDALMGKGMFDYYVATLPAVVRILAFLGMGGDRDVGLKQLHTAAEKGVYSQTPSKLFLSDIYARLEGEPEKSLAILKSVNDDYPNSPFIHMLYVISLYNGDHVELLTESAQEFRNKVETGVFKKEYLIQGYFALGAAHFKKREWQKAINFFNLAIATGVDKNPFLTWSILYKGYALDALKKRDEAKKHYKDVLSRLRRWGSYDNAKTRLKKPFNGTDEEIAKLSL